MQNKRRNILKALTLGGGAVSLKALPEQWAKPVVDSVLLPVHAGTSNCRSGCGDLVIPGLTLDCSENPDTDGFVYLLYSLNDDACGCAVLSGPVQSSSAPSPADNQILIFYSAETGEGAALSIFVQVDGGGADGQVPSCSIDAPSDTGTLARNVVSFPSNSPYIARFSLVRTGSPTTYAVSDLVISPA